MVPVGQAIVYLRPLYVASSTNPLPQLNYVIGVVGQKVVIESSLAQTLSAVLNTTVSTSSPSSGAGSGPVTSVNGQLPAQVQSDLQAAQTDYNNTLAALKFDQLGTYQSDITAMDQQIANAQASLKSSTGSSSGVTSTTTAKSNQKSSKSDKSSKDKAKGSVTSTTLAAADGAH